MKTYNISIVYTYVIEALDFEEAIDYAIDEHENNTADFAVEVEERD